MDLDRLEDLEDAIASERSARAREVKTLFFLLVVLLSFFSLGKDACFIRVHIRVVCTFALSRSMRVHASRFRKMWNKRTGKTVGERRVNRY